MTNGDLFIVGGSSTIGAIPMASAEIFHLGSESFSPAGTMNLPRIKPAVCQLSDGRIVVIGGSTMVPPVSTIDVYEGGQWKVAPCTEIDQRELSYGATPTAFGLPGGKILFYGGVSKDGTPRQPKLIDTTKTPWKVKTLDGNHARNNFAAIKLRDGRPCITGGGGGITIFDPETETFSEYPMAVNRQYHGIIQHPDGKIQMYGGAFGNVYETSVETFDPANPGPSQVVGNLRIGLGFMGSNLLQNGETLHGGGPDKDGYPSAVQVSYNYATNVSNFTSRMQTPRTLFSSTVTNNGRVAYIGGVSSKFGTVEASVEIFDSYSMIMINMPKDTILLGSTLQFSLVSGGPVVWSCTKNVGTISETGLYTAPTPVTPESGKEDPTFVVITATSTTNPSNTVSVTLLLEKPTT
jgi:hypothetical protein